MSVLDYIKLGVILAVFGTVIYLVDDYSRVKAENEKLTTQLTAANLTIKAQDELAKKNKEIQKREDDLIEKIEKEPSENDADTAPVLYNGIKRLH